MLRTLNDEGFDIKERELMRVRGKYRWLLRVPNGMKATSVKSDHSVSNHEQEPVDPAIEHIEQALFATEMKSGVVDAKEVMIPRGASPDLAPEVIAKRQARQEKLQAESDDRWEKRKRRRRTRGWAGLPADPPGPPRFPSETTIDESKVLLGLDSKLYREIREQFQSICEQDGFIKKTIAGPERWQAAKDRLKRENAHLQQVFWANSSQMDAKGLALDVICTDVTKRMRTLERRMTIAEAKNALGVNPEESRQIRHEFYQTLKDDHFTSKLEAGDDHWKELKAQWIEGNDLLKRILAPGDADPDHENKVKAMEVLCRDVMKRLRDDQTKRDPARKKHASNRALGSGVQQMITHPHPADSADLQIDPSLLLAAANDPSLTMDGQQQQELQYAQQAFDHTNAFGASQQAKAPVAVWFKLSPNSQIHQMSNPSKVWLGTLMSRTIDELREQAMQKHPGLGLVSIHGIAKDMNGNDSYWNIEEDDELNAYLDHMEKGKPQFSINLMVFS